MVNKNCVRARAAPKGGEYLVEGRHFHSRVQNGAVGAVLEEKFTDLLSQCEYRNEGEVKYTGILPSTEQKYGNLPSTVLEKYKMPAKSIMTMTNIAERAPEGGSSG